jgi:hypothetical protein
MSYSRPTRRPLLEEFPKGKNVSVWVNPDLLPAFDKALDSVTGRTKEGTYATEALVQRLRREGHLKDNAEADVAAKAFELSREFGPAAVSAKLDELAAAAAAAAVQV